MLGGAPGGGIRLKGLLACGVTALALGYLVPTVGAASGPAAAMPDEAGRPAAPPPALDSLFLGPGGPTQQPLTRVLFNLHGTPLPAGVLAVSLGDALADVGLQPQPGELVRLNGLPASLDEPLPEAAQVDVVSVSTDVRVESRPLAFGVQDVADPSLDAGTTVVDSEGAPGTELVTLEVTLEDGRPVASRAIGERVAQAPVDRVVRHGTRPPPLPEDGSYRATFTMRSNNVTAYCLTGRTRTGTIAGPGSIAVDPAVIPLGSHLYVEGYGFGWAVDTGGGIHGDDVDLWMTCPQAIQWGRRSVTVYVLDH